MLMDGEPDNVFWVYRSPVPVQILEILGTTGGGIVYLYPGEDWKNSQQMLQETLQTLEELVEIFKVFQVD